jgi:hypothetical protein
MKMSMKMMQRKTMTPTMARMQMTQVNTLMIQERKKKKKMRRRHMSSK